MGARCRFADGFGASFLLFNMVIIQVDAGRAGGSSWPGPWRPGCVIVRNSA
jgi:hypothetical protein